MISIINYGLGNLGSIKNMFKKIGVESAIIDSPDQLESATKLILPGVGAFDTGMEYLRNRGWIEKLHQKVIVEKTPTLGICLGMQLMCRMSQEGETLGLNWIEADVKRFDFDDPKLKVPHIGWNQVYAMKDSELLKDELKERRFYFVHSFYVAMESEEDILFKTTYGHEFTSAFEKNNLIGMQFHPEKSHKFGIAILKNFAANY